MNRFRLLTGDTKLDRFLLAVYTAALAAGSASLWSEGFGISTPTLMLALGAAAAAPHLVKLGHNTFLSTAFPFVLASAVVGGLRGALVTSVAASIGSNLAKIGRMASHKMVFNVAGYTLAGLTAASVYRMAGGNPVSYSSEGSLRALLLATCGFYLVNTLLVTTAAALECRRSVLELWREKFFWTAYSYLAGGSLALLVLLLLEVMGLHAFLIVFPLCALIYFSWQIYAHATGLTSRG